MCYRLTLFFILLLTVFATDALAGSSYRYQALSETGATASSNGVIFKEQFYLLGKSPRSDFGYFIDIYNLNDTAATKPMRRIRLDRAARAIKISGDLLMIEHNQYISVLRLSVSGEQNIGNIDVKPRVSGSYRAAIQGSQIVVRKIFTAGPTDIDIYNIDGSVKLQHTVSYLSGGMRTGLQLDSQFIYLHDTASLSCTACSETVLTTIRLQDYELTTNNIAYDISSPSLLGNGYFLAFSANSPFNLNIYKIIDNNLTKLYKIDSPTVASAKDGVIHYITPTYSMLCLAKLTDTAVEDQQCLPADNLRTRSAGYHGAGEYAYLSNDQLFYFDATQRKISAKFKPFTPSIIQFGISDNQLIGMTEQGYAVLDTTNQQIKKITSLPTPVTLSDSNMPFYINGDKFSHYRRSNFALNFETYLMKIDEFTLSSSYSIPLINSLSQDRSTFGERYFANFNKDLEIHGIGGEHLGLQKFFPANSIQTNTGFTLTPAQTYTKQTFHLDNMLFQTTDSALYYLPIHSVAAQPLVKLTEADAVATTSDSLWVALNNTLRQYQWRDGQYLATAAATSSGCTTEAKPTSLDISGGKALVVMHQSDPQTFNSRNFLCIYDVLGTTFQFELQLELPSGVYKANHQFAINGNDLYGVLKNDGRLFHFTKNSAPTFATRVVLKEDTTVIPLITVTDPENDLVTLAVSKDGTYGKASIVNNQLSYTPNPNYHGPDLVGITATDTAGNVTAQDISITVSPVNDLPVAQALQFSVAQGEKYSGQLNATDVDGDTLKFSAATTPKLGTLSLNPDGSFSFQANSSGDESFEVLVSDQAGGETKLTVSVKVTAAVTVQPPATKSSSSGSSGLISLGLLVLMLLQRNMTIQRRKM